MTSPLLSMLQNDGPQYLYSDEYFTFIQSHVEYLRNHPGTSTVRLDPRDVENNIHNFHGLFRRLRIREEDHQLLMLVNRFTDPAQLTTDVKYLYVPDNTIVDRLKNIFRTTLA